MKISNIVVIEDDENHAILAKRVIKKVLKDCSVTTIKTSEDALKYFACLGSKILTTVPDIIFLDLKMPRMTGSEVLKTIRTIKGFSKIPIVILSTSDESKDRNSAYRLLIFKYIEKPLTIEKLKNLIAEISL